MEVRSSFNIACKKTVIYGSYAVEKRRLLVEVILLLAAIFSNKMKQSDVTDFAV